MAAPLAVPQRAPRRSRPRRQHGLALPFRRGGPLGGLPGGSSAVDRSLGGGLRPYEFLFQANTLFHHSNVRLPLRLERTLNGLLVTPRMHGIHHSQVKGETNSNYSVVFPWWDWLHRSLVLGIRQRDISVGVPGYAQPEDNRLPTLAALPFQRQRDYWGELERPARTGPPGAAFSMLE